MLITYCFVLWTTGRQFWHSWLSQWEVNILLQMLLASHVDQWVRWVSPLEAGILCSCTAGLASGKWISFVKWCWLHVWASMGEVGEPVWGRWPLFKHSWLSHVKWTSFFRYCWLHMWVSVGEAGEPFRGECPPVGSEYPPSDAAGFTCGQVWVRWVSPVGGRRPLLRHSWLSQREVNNLLQMHNVSQLVRRGASRRQVAGILMWGALSLTQ